MSAKIHTQPEPQRLIVLTADEFTALIERTMIAVLSRQEAHPQPEKDLLNIKEAAELLSLTVPTVYVKVHKRELPFMKQGKRLYFSRADLMAYVKAGRTKSTNEIEQEAKAYLSTTKKRLTNG